MDGKTKNSTCNAIHGGEFTKIICTLAKCSPNKLIMFVGRIVDYMILVFIVNGIHILFNGPYDIKIEGVRILVIGTTIVAVFCSSFIALSMYVTEAKKLEAYKRGVCDGVTQMLIVCSILIASPIIYDLYSIENANVRQECGEDCIEVSSNEITQNVKSKEELSYDRQSSGSALKALVKDQLGVSFTQESTLGATVDNTAIEQAIFVPTDDFNTLLSLSR